MRPKWAAVEIGFTRMVFWKYLAARWLYPSVDRRRFARWRLAPWWSKSMPRHERNEEIAFRLCPSFCWTFPKRNKLWA